MKRSRPLRPRLALETSLESVLETARRAADRAHLALADRLCAQVTGLDPDHGPAWELRSRIAQRQDDGVMRALMFQRKALDAEPNRAAWHHRYGTLCRRAGRLADAASSLRTSIRLRPYRAEAMVELGMVLVSMGGREDAEYWAARALQIDPENREARSLLEFVLDGVPDAGAA